MTPANAAALARVTAVAPLWTGVRPAREAIDLPDHVLLHAGPALADPTRPPPPMLNAAVLSCLHEGWAADEQAALAMIARGAVRLEPSHTRHVSTPLVALVSASTTLAEIRSGASVQHGFLGTGAGPQQRFGARDAAIVERLRFRETRLLPGFRELLAEPVDLLAIARCGLAEGDDLHNRLSSANVVLHAVLGTRKADSPAAQDALRTVLEAPLYFLNVWMPACQLMLRAAEGTPGSTLVTRLCANGEVAGMQVAGLPGRWFTAPAAPVQGPFMKGAPDGASMPPATGDSGVIDAFGLGGQVLRRAPSLKAAFAPWLPADDDARADRMTAGLHPVLGVKVCVDAAAVVPGTPLLLSTGMVEENGRGLLGRGVCTMPVEPFVQAVSAVRGTA